jgi:hypothetical protein
VGGACSTDRERRDAYKILIGKAEGNIPLEKCVGK